MVESHHALDGTSGRNETITADGGGMQNVAAGVWSRNNQPEPNATGQTLKPGDHINFGNLSIQEGVKPNMDPVDKDGEQSALAEAEAQLKLGNLNLDDKLKLGGEQMRSLNTLEESILTGDSKGLEDELHKYKDTPGAARPVMNVLKKDMQAAGLDVGYYTDYAATDAGPAQFTGMLSITDRQPENQKGPYNFLTAYTNPNSSAFADHYEPIATHEYNSDYDIINKAPADTLKYLGGIAEHNLAD